MAHTPIFITGSATNLPIESNSVNLIITHPPYLKVDVSRYGGDPKKQINYKQDKKEMLSLLIKSAKEAERVLTPNGTLSICIGPIESLPYDFIYKVQQKTKLKVVAEIVWHLDKTINPEKLGGNQAIWFCLSKNPATVYYNPFMVKRYLQDPWVLPMNNMASPIDQELSQSKKGFTADAYPEEIADRLIKIFTKPGDVVLDQFGGSGVTCAKAYELGRISISNDISEDQTSLAKKRIKLTGGLL